MEPNIITAVDNRGLRRRPSPSLQSGGKKGGVGVKKRRARERSKRKLGWFEHAKQRMDKTVEREDREEGSRNSDDWRAKEREWRAQFEAGRRRRKALSSSERLRENGEALRQEIESDPDMIVALEGSSSKRASCRAGDDCIQVQTNCYLSQAITDEYRICVHGVKNITWFGRTKHYYHVACFQHMFDLNTLLPSKFKIAGGPGCYPLMIQKWFQHKGCINPGEIARYIDKVEVYEEAHRESSFHDINWQLTHMRECRGKDQNECKCPPRPEWPTKPRLENYTTEKENGCNLTDVIEHTGCRLARSM
jgi:hypothetical protein